jgi:hypothetical protein
VREHILAEIKRLAEERGRPPGRQAFEAATGIRPSAWYGVHWARWGDALAEAGFAANDWQARSDHNFILRKIAEAYRHFGHIPSHGDLKLYRRRDAEFPWVSTIANNFGGKGALIEALRKWLSHHGEFADVAAMLPAEPPMRSPRGSKPKDGSVYLIQSGKHYKIGRSDELERRVKEIRVALPEAATLVHTIVTDDPSGIEAYWHRRFADRRANGEWFSLTPADVAAFSRRKFQ